MDLSDDHCCRGPAAQQTPAQTCRGAAPAEAERGPARGPTPWIVGAVNTPAGEAPQVSTALRLSDHLGAWKTRWAVGRMHYGISPGLYAVGRPTAESPVLVSASYKMSFDRLRSQLTGMDAWILVLDTQGINVWCAAGKGTFSTDELVGRIEATKLADVVSHRTLIVPQLGAVGVAAHEVRGRSGFRIVYGPIRAEDVKAFLAAGMKATPEMRRVRFPFRERVALIPVELVMAAKFALLIAAGFLILAGLGPDGYSLARAASVGAWSASVFLAICVLSLMLTPALLPWLPGRAFALKGLCLGLAFLGAALGCAWSHAHVLGGWLTLVAWCLLIPAVASFLSMNFTGATTYTSLSGVRREMRVAVPLQAMAAAVGVVLWLIGRFV